MIKTVRLTLRQAQGERGGDMSERLLLPVQRSLGEVGSLTKYQDEWE